MKLMKQLCLSAFAGLVCLSGTTAMASPMTYTVFAITDVKLAGHYYHNAKVTLRFVGDTDNIVQLPNLSNFSGDCLSTGTASLTIVSGGQRIKANFLPSQLMVTVDTYNGGAGFSANIGGDCTHLANITPAYPLALDGGTVDGLGELPQADLNIPGSWTGHAWSCTTFPVSSGFGGNGQCADPASLPLQTDHGEIFFYQVYLGSLVHGLMTDDYEGSLNNGIFSVLPGAQ